MSELADFEARICAAYAEEVAAAAPVSELAQLPLTYEHLTPQWLTALVCAGREDVTVSSFRAEDADDLGRGHARIWLEYSGPAEGLPASVFCKDSQRLELRVFNAFLIAGEVDFYNGLGPRAGFETPDCLYAAYDHETFNSLLIFRDLREHGLDFCTHETKVTRDAAEQQMRHLAHVHATRFAAIDSDPLMTGLYSFRDRYERVDAIFKGHFDAVVMKGFDAAASVIPEGVLARREGVWPCVARALEAQWRAVPTLTHNDSHIDNWYLAPGGQARLGDWQLVSRGDPAFDLALVVSTSPATEHRRAWERELIELYVSELAAAGGPRIAPEEAFSRYRAQLFMALAWWTPTVKSDVGFEFHDMAGNLEVIRRVTTAIDDLDAFGS